MGFPTRSWTTQASLTREEGGIQASQTREEGRIQVILDPPTSAV